MLFDCAGWDTFPSASPESCSRLVRVAEGNYSDEPLVTIDVVSIVSRFCSAIATPGVPPSCGAMREPKSLINYSTRSRAPYSASKRYVARENPPFIFIFRFSSPLRVCAGRILFGRPAQKMSLECTVPVTTSLDPGTYCPPIPIDAFGSRAGRAGVFFAKGHSTRPISQQLHLSIKTIEMYRAHIKRERRFHNADEMVKLEQPVSADRFRTRTKMMTDSRRTRVAQFPALSFHGRSAPHRIRSLILWARITFSQSVLHMSRLRFGLIRHFLWHGVSVEAGEGVRPKRNRSKLGSK